MRIKNAFISFRNTYFHENMDLRHQAFHLLVMSGIVAGIVVAALSPAVNAGKVTIALNLSAVILGIILLRVVEVKKCYRLCSWITIILGFMMLFPALFFSAGGYKSGMPCFFVFAMFFTAIVLTKAERVLALIAEILLYSACFLTAYHYPQTVRLFQREFDYIADIIICMTVTGAVLVTTVLVLLRIHDNRQMQIQELNRELAARNEALMKYDTMKSEFLATVAHEISTPLAIISASGRDTLDLLKEPDFSKEEIEENQLRIERKVRLVDSIVTDLIDTTAIENGRLSLSLRPMELAVLLDRICGNYMKKLDIKNNRFSFEFGQGLPPVLLDPNRIEQVVTNLLSNAVRYTENGVIEVKLAREGEYQAVSIRDNGAGMDEETAANIFKRHNSTQDDYWRHGIGLFVCYGIVKAHGGEIRMESERGRGTMVTFALKEGGAAQ